MYEHYEPTERVFVDREEHLDWMTEALERCKERSVVLHLRGIGGIGKSSLLDRWKSTIDETIYLDCERYTEFYDRLNVIAKGAVHLGVNLRRFDVLWQIRQRFVEGVEPVKEEGREWAKEIAMAIPFIGSLASIGSAISAAGSKVAPKLKSMYGDVAKWLQTRLGKDHVQKLLEILWKEPRRAEFLYLDALLEDLNNRKTSERPIVFLFDHSERVDSETCRWRYRGRDITETELWYVFLCSLSNCVGVVASRRALSSETGEELEIEESELTELDRESCIELIEQRGIESPELKDRIVSVSGGNPFVVGAICDLADSGSLSLNDVEDLRADTLEAVRLKTWRRLFGQAEPLFELVEKAGLVPFFNRRIMTIVAPAMRTDQWDRLTRISFVRDRGDGTWVLHDLARELIVAELGPRLQASTDDVATLLEESSAEDSDYTLLGLAISVRALASEREAEARVASVVIDLMWSNPISDALVFIDAVLIDTKVGQAIVQGLKGGLLIWVNRVADGEHALLSALETFREFGERIPDELLVHKALTLTFLGVLLNKTQRASEAEESFRETLRIYRGLDETTLGFRPQDLGVALQFFGYSLLGVYRPEEALETLREAHQLYQESAPPASPYVTRSITSSLSAIGNALFMTGRTSESEETHREALGVCRKLANEMPLIEITAANCCNNLGELLRLTSRPYEAIELYREAFQLTKEFAKKEPEAMSQSLVLHLTNLALPLRQIGRYAEAEEKYREALARSRELAEKAPEAFSQLVAWSLFDYAVLLRQTDRASEAEEACREALSIHRELVASSPGKHMSKMAWNLNNLAVLLRQTGRNSEAEEAYLEALDIAREITHRAPEVVFFTDLLATILNNLAVLLRQSGRAPEAKETLQEALEIRRRLAKKSPELFLHRVATTLNNLSILLFETGETSEAESALGEALQLRRELIAKSPDQYQAGVGSTLNNLGILLKRTGRSQESQDAYSEAIDIGEDLVSKAPTVYHHELRRALCNYALLLSDLDSTDTLQKNMTRLKELGVESLPESEEWSEEEEEEANPPAVI
ncbi:MAG: tetratricopeptide repeat protein [Candidatus Thorarchaeota archaeon]|jgi:tetratricopeptide (TPR) repeat protein